MRLLFDYTASDRAGILSRGQVEAADRAAASKMLARDGLFVVAVTPATKPVLPTAPEPDELELPLRTRLEAAVIDAEATVAVDSVRRPLLPQRSWSRMDRAIYLRQLQMMFDAGIPLYRSAAVLAEGREYSLLVDAKLKKVPADLEQGRTLSKALERSGLFTPMIVNSVRLGEQSGRLVPILNALSDTEERGVQLTRALISRLTYPAVVLLAMSGGLLVLGHVMSRAMASMPSLQKSYSPMLAALNGTFQNRAFLPLLLLSLVLAVVSARRIWRIHRIRLGIERVLLAWPIVGPLLRRLEANSVTSHLALLSKAGFPLDKGLGLCADLVGTLSFRRALLLSQQEIRNGDELTPSMKRAELFPQDVLALVQAGEVAGSLERSLDTAARYCAEQVERTLESVLAVVEPLLIGLMGIAIGTVLILTFVPIFSTLQDL